MSDILEPDSLTEKILALIDAEKPGSHSNAKTNAEVCVQVGMVVGILLAWVKLHYPGQEHYEECIKKIVHIIDQTACDICKEALETILKEKKSIS